ncbi:syndecan isoform X1 [Neodiprion pinetum]|uniref:syndecan isoform X1 n=1 Tax=Neodiprion pinetum TaxID=441929 RepID=UPI00076FB314|nr:syndecan isoform X1 [Neodiprion pinetum]XP_046613157.1 syndecan isoform X1 [Neodiprion virginianus]
MHPRIYLFLAFGGVILSGCNAAASEKDQQQQSSKERSAGSVSYNSYLDDDIYLEDQGEFEGSGRGGGEVRDDLEASGSGLGPDDEDGEDGRSFIPPRKETVPKKVETKAPYIEDTVVKTNQPVIETVNKPDTGVDVNEPAGEYDHDEDTGDSSGPDMNPKQEDRASSFFAQPGVLAAVIGGAVVGLLCAILVVMFIVYRMRKKDEGSYALDEPRRSPAAQAYPKPGAPHHNREFYA